MFKICHCTLFILFLFQFTAKSQETKPILEAPENWQHERLNFPLDFAPSIKLSGFEDLRFAPGWADSTSQEFWTYTFVWYLTKKERLSTGKLTKAINAYYDGLMRIEERQTTELIPPGRTQCKLKATPEGFSGKLTLYDAFFTQKTFVLYVKVKEIEQPVTGRQFVWFWLSPQPFDHPVWDTFNAVELNTDPC